MLIPLDRLLYPEPVTAGMNILVIASLTLMYRATNQDADPIQVTAEGPYWRITDGRHRAIAAMAAGRKTIAAETSDG